VTFSWLTAVVVLMYLVGTFVYGLQQSQRGGAEPTFSPSRMSIWEAASLLAGFTLGSSATYGIAGDAARYGLTYLVWFPLSILAGWCVTGLLFARPFHRLGNITVPELMQSRFDSRTCLAATVSTLFYAFFVMLLQIYTLALIIQAVLPQLSTVQVTTISFIVCAGSVTFTGILGTIRMNLVHAVVMVLAFAVALGILWLRVGGLTTAFLAMQTKLSLMSGHSPSYTRWLSLTGMGWGIIVQFMIGKAGRLGGISLVANVAASSDTEKSAMASFGLAGILGAVPPLLAGGVGILTIVCFGLPSDNQPVYTSIGLGLSQISPLLAGFLMAAIAAGLVATYGSNAICFASLLVKDVLQRYWRVGERTERTIYPAIITTVSAVCALYVAFHSLGDILPFLYSTALPCTTPITVACLFALRSRRSSATAAFWAIGSGLFAALFWGLVLNNPFGVPNMVFSFVVPSLVMGLDLTVATVRARWRQRLSDARDLL